MCNKDFLLFRIDIILKATWKQRRYVQMRMPRTSSEKARSLCYNSAPWRLPHSFPCGLLNSSVPSSPRNISTTFSSCAQRQALPVWSVLRRPSITRPSGWPQRWRGSPTSWSAWRRSSTSSRLHCTAGSARTLAQCSPSSGKSNEWHILIHDFRVWFPCAHYINSR